MAFGPEAAKSSILSPLKGTDDKLSDVCWLAQARGCDAAPRAHHAVPRPPGETVVLVGHIGVAIGAHGIRTIVPLWLLIVASQLPDWADAVVCSTGTQTTVTGMLTHSLPAVAMLALAGAVVALAITRDFAGSALVGAVVVSHVLGDYFTGIKPSWAGGPTIGLGMYARPAIDFLFESVVITGGWFLYRQSLPVDRRSSREALLLLVALLAIQGAADVVFWLQPGIPKC